ncbi:MAG: sensor histidine kinase [Pseudomonadota bacterium]
MKLQSLRARLIVIILTPLLLVSVLAAAWQFRNTTARAADIFDRGLLSAALAISRDVAISGGDALSPTTRNLVSGTSGGELFYHVVAPDGVFITGYATPPTPPTKTRRDHAAPHYYDATYLGRDVRVLRFQDATTLDGVSGIFTISVWQDQKIRSSFVEDVVTRTIAVISLLLISVALIVWFGVGFGLRPLLDLQDAIAKRNPNELAPIRRNVPVEAMGIVSTLNALLDRVSRRISSKDEFISNAAHQLRNPIAGVLALAEAVENAPSPDAAKRRSAELVKAARDATHLTNQLLSFERARGSDLEKTGKELDLRDLVSGVISRFRAQQAGTSLKIGLTTPDEPIKVRCDELMLQEALLNILTNSKVHGGPGVSDIQVAVEAGATSAVIAIRDDGVGIAEDKIPLIIGRFGQANAGPGSGLGLPIAVKVVENLGGELKVESAESGACVTMILPVLHQPKRELRLQHVS